MARTGRTRLGRCLSSALRRLGEHLLALLFFIWTYVGLGCWAVAGAWSGESLAPGAGQEEEQGLGNVQRVWTGSL